MKTHFILFVQDQARSTQFYKKTLVQKPKLNVPGMTEFELSNKTVLGLMPEKGIKKLLGKKLPDPEKANGFPRSELYLLVNNPEEYHARAINNGGTELSKLSTRDWGHKAAYSLDPDGHVLAFAEEISCKNLHP